MKVGSEIIVPPSVVEYLPSRTGREQAAVTKDPGGARTESAGLFSKSLVQTTATMLCASNNTLCSERGLNTSSLDPGNASAGVTNFGVTGYGFNDARELLGQKQITNRDELGAKIKSMTLRDAADVYHTLFALRVQIGKFPPRLGAFFADTFINMRPQNAIILLNKALDPSYRPPKNPPSQLSTTILEKLAKLEPADESIVLRRLHDERVKFTQTRTREDCRPGVLRRIEEQYAKALPLDTDPLFQHYKIHGTQNWDFLDRVRFCNGTLSKETGATDYVQVYALQERIRALGIEAVNGKKLLMDGEFGPQMEAVTRELRKQWNMLTGNPTVDASWDARLVARLDYELVRQKQTPLLIKR